MKKRSPKLAAEIKKLEAEIRRMHASGKTHQFLAGVKNPRRRVSARDIPHVRGRVRNPGDSSAVHARIEAQLAKLNADAKRDADMRREMCSRYLDQPRRNPASCAANPRRRAVRNPSSCSANPYRRARNPAKSPAHARMNAEIAKAERAIAELNRKSREDAARRAELMESIMGGTRRAASNPHRGRSPKFDGYEPLPLRRNPAGHGVTRPRPAKQLRRVANPSWTARIFEPKTGKNAGKTFMFVPKKEVCCSTAERLKTSGLVMSHHPKHDTGRLWLQPRKK